MPKDYYIVLGVNRGANLNKIKKAYRTVSKKYHPDITQTKEGAERFLEIKEAYETLSDEAKRKRYDEELTAQGSELRISRVPETIEERRTPFDEMERWFSSFTDEFFEGFLPGFFDSGKAAYGRRISILRPFSPPEKLLKVDFFLSQFP